MSKKAVVVISFGTSYAEAEKAIINIENKIQEAFPEHDFFRAFTSGMIIKKLKRTKDIHIGNPEEVLGQLAAEGYEEVVCQPTHIINGEEYDKMCRMIQKHSESFRSLKVGAPLLTEEDDFKACAPASFRLDGLINQFFGNRMHTHANSFHVVTCNISICMDGNDRNLRRGQLFYRSNVISNHPTDTGADYNNGPGLSLHGCPDTFSQLIHSPEYSLMLTHIRTFKIRAYS